jgi:serine protease Do
MMNLLQTSAAVNPGNSGGGLFNRYGELIGIVNAKSSGSDIEGIGFAIPINLAKPIADALIEYGYIPGRIDFGATLIDILDARTAMMYRVQTLGVYVSQADSDGALQSGDRIISIDGKDIKSSADIKSLLDTRKVGDTLSITVSRNGKTVTVEQKLKQAKS